MTWATSGGEYRSVYTCNAHHVRSRRPPTTPYPMSPHLAVNDCDKVRHATLCMLGILASTVSKLRTHSEDSPESPHGIKVHFYQSAHRTLDAAYWMMIVRYICIMQGSPRFFRAFPLSTARRRSGVRTSSTLRSSCDGRLLPRYRKRPNRCRRRQVWRAGDWSLGDPWWHAALAEVPHAFDDVGLCVKVCTQTIQPVAPQVLL
ncbi:hypothetical protein C8R43DRAFT_577 [Mycena crocata]|nr:hypothetical protein C8R43DRAFT_577 [Mycena crocata]